MERLLWPLKEEKMREKIYFQPDSNSEPITTEIDHINHLTIKAYYCMPPVHIY
jgi:hypothetical protein